MDVRRLFCKIPWKPLIFSLFCLQLLACSQQKTTQEVFPDPPPKQKSATACDGQQIKNRFIAKWSSGAVTFEKSLDRDTLLKDFVEPHLNELDMVEYDYKMNLALPNEISDAVTTSSEEPTEDWGQQLIQAPQVWNEGAQGEGVIVAVIDTGADLTHPQLAGQLAINSAEIAANGIDDDQNGFVDDVTGWDFVNDSKTPTDPTDHIGHGTHVSGIILADPTQGKMKGIAPKAKLLPIKFIDKVKDANGKVQDVGGSVSEAITAIKYARDRGARVINASWGGSGCSKILKSTIEDLAANQILFVTAAGNSGVDIDQYPEYPAAFPVANMLTVIALNAEFRMASFTNYGYIGTHIAAPGQSIFSSVPKGYAYLSGTSMAAPFVSGAAALLTGIRPHASSAEVKSALLNSVDAGSFATSSKGRLNLPRAVSEIQKLPQ